ncbi:MAG: DNA cytosine methyltransferase [Lachnospiraceae bacterium]|nr:DNA cytosine methyltransferase [Lachnospiraceae bacterium]
MLKLATVFSGIGAIEHALDRMQIEHEIVFACDNGDVELEMPQVRIDIDSMEKELKSLRATIKKVCEKIDDEESIDYASQLDFMLNGVENEYDKLISKLDVKDSDVDTVDCAVADAATEIKNAISNTTASKKKKYQELEKIYKDGFKKNESKLFFILRLGLTLEEDKFECSSENIVQLFELNKKGAKRTVKSGRDISERLQMLHDKLFYLDTNNELRQLGSYEERKAYVDNLYAGKENQNKVKQSYMANYKINPKDFHWNVAFLDGKQYEGQVDLFVGGSPCQSFSLVGKQRGLEDTRGTLFYEYARLVNEIKPKVFIYENVKAILSNDEGRTWETMKEVFSSLGYKVFYDFNGKPSVLNAKDYGIPQNRERMFVVGFRGDIELAQEFEFPTPIPLEKKMQDFLLDNVSGAYYLPKKGVDFVTSEKNLTKRYTQIDGEVALCQKKNQQFNWHGDFVFVEENKDMEKTMEDLEKYFLSEKVEKYVMATGTKNFYSRPKTDLEVARPLLTTMHKMHRAGVDNYVHTNGRLRKLTPRECLRLMGFCDSFEIVVSDTSMYQQAGNSIVVDVLIAIMNQIIKALGTDFND